MKQSSMDTEFTHKLLGHLNARRADGGYSQYMKKLPGLDLLILDDFGLVQLTPQNANDLYEIILDRYKENQSSLQAIDF